MTKEVAIEALETFKGLLEKWEYGNPSNQTRTDINRQIPIIRDLVLKAGTHRTFTIAPPPMIGGLIMKNVDPFTCIFEPPYRQSVVPMLIDSVDAAIGVIETKDIFSKEKTQSKKAVEKVRLSNKVFIVHGRDNGLKETTARFLEKLGLEPIILHEQTNKGRTIIEKFEDYADVGFAVVLMTPDDLGGLADSKNILSARARQNVVFELGYFIGKLGRMRVAAIVQGDIELPTDISGVVYIGVDNNDAWKMLLAKEIKAAGLVVDLNKTL